MMKQYMVKAFIYSEAGALTNKTIIRYFDIPEEAKDCYNDFKSQRYEETGFKMYEPELHILARKKVTNVNEFFAQFEVPIINICRGDYYDR